MNLKVVNKKVFVVSDIHNDADRFKLLLEKIDFAEDDILILAGDIFDRGNQPIELYFEILKHPNIQVMPHSISTLPILMARRSHCLRRLTACKTASTLGL